MGGLRSGCSGDAAARAEAVGAALEEVLARDPGGRGVAALRVPGDLLAAARLLAGARRVGLVTGFPRDGAPETDGPPGVLALDRALARLGREVVHLACPLVAPLLRGLGRAVREVDLPAGDAGTPGRADAALEGLVAGFGAPDAGRPGAPDVGAPVVLVAVERPGRAADGSYRNMRGRPLEVDALDELLLAAARRRPPVPTVGVGDGGNEAGTGACAARVAATVPHGPALACVVPADRCVGAGTSTWGAWGLVAALEVVTGRRDLLPTAGEVAADLAALVALGAVDGVTGAAAPTIDGLPREASEAVLRDLAALARDAGVQVGEGA